METFKRALVEKGIKPTFQRIKILEYLHHNRVHPTVDMIYAALFKEVPTLSKTTVYNTVDVLRKKGVVNVLTVSESELRYEYNTDPHYHFICKNCKTIYDLNIDFPYKELKEIDSHRVEEVYGYFRGICRNCL